MDLLSRQAMGQPPELTPEYLAFNNSHEILSIVGTFTALALATVLARVYIRVRLLHAFGADDGVMVAAMVLCLGVCASIIGQTKSGLGKHVLAIPPENMIEIQKWLLAQGLMIVAGVSLVKVSIGLFLLRLASKMPRYRIFIIGVIIFTICFCLACLGTLIFNCIPMKAAWDMSLRPPMGTAKCFSIKTFISIALFNSITNIVTDIIFATVPIPLIWKLQLNLRVKISLISILSLGYMACAAAIVKAHKQYHFFETPDWTVHDSFNVWNIIEFTVGIMAASLPCLKPLFNWFLETARALSSYTGNRTPRTGLSNGYRISALGYVKQNEESSIALRGITSSQRTGDGMDKNPYDVTCKATSGSRTPGDMKPDSWDDESGSKNSEDDTLSASPQPRRGIVRTTEVHITR